MWSEIFVANTTDDQDLKPHVQRYGQPFRKVGGTMDGCMIANLVDRIFSCSEPAVKACSVRKDSLHTIQAFIFLATFRVSESS